MNSAQTRKPAEQLASRGSRPTLGVDVGGTFTDLVVVEDGRFRLIKIPSTPADPAASVLDGLSRLDPLAEAGVVHGTTVATNAVLERRGARTAFVVTEGFRDLLRIGRGARPDLYALEPRLPEPLVPEDLCFEVPERLAADGSVVKRLTAPAAASVAASVAAESPQAVAVCLFYCYLDAAHERLMYDALTNASPRPEHVSLSSQVLPVFREFERATTTVVNAYVAPAMGRYLARLAAHVEGRSLVVMASHGGTVAPADAAAIPAATVLSGPAAGVMGAKLVADRAQAPRFISFDMGGTSTDVALCDGDVPFRSSCSVGGVSVHLPGIAIETVGAGGGSLIHCDAAGTIWVGPMSAGAVPGPAAYGRGGTAPTLTDAHVVLGRLPAAGALAGGLRLDVDAARRAIASVADRTGTTLDEAALDAVEVASAVMERALRRVSVFEGYDPRDFTLIAFGGAGPLHVCELAEALEMRRALVPLAPGALSALGLATASHRASASRSVRGLRGIALDRSSIAGVIAALTDQVAGAVTGHEGLQSGGERRWEVVAEARYRGQSSEIPVAWPATCDLAERFHAAHERRFGYARPGSEIEVVTVRVTATGDGDVAMPTAPAPVQTAIGQAEIVTGRGSRSRVPVLPRTGLRIGERVSGPAVLSQEDATTWIAPGWTAVVGPFGDLLLERFGGS